MLGMGSLHCLQNHCHLSFDTTPVTAAGPRPMTAAGFEPMPLTGLAEICQTKAFSASGGPFLPTSDGPSHLAPTGSSGALAPRIRKALQRSSI